MWCVVASDLETSCMRRPWPTGGCCAKNKQTYKIIRLDDLVPGICSPLRDVIVFFHFWTNYDLENEQVVRVCLVCVENRLHEND